MAGCDTSLGQEEETWCHFVEPGTYRYELVGVPEGFRTRATCVSRWVLFPEYPDELPAATVSAADPVWSCYGDSWAPLEVSIRGSEVPAGLALTLVDAAGADVSSSCARSEASPDDVVGEFVAEYRCLGLVDGDYVLSASVDGAPTLVQCTVVRPDPDDASAPPFVDYTSGRLVIGGDQTAACEVSLGQSPAPAATTTTAPAAAGPSSTLPVTGGGNPTAAWWALGMLVLGLMASWAARRNRSEPTNGWRVP